MSLKDTFTLLLGRRYNRAKRNRESNLVQNAPKDQIDPSVSTADRLAAGYGVSPATVKRAEIALSLKEDLAKLARERQLGALKQNGAVPPKLAERGETRDELADMSGVSGRTR